MINDIDRCPTLHDGNHHEAVHVLRKVSILRHNSLSLRRLQLLSRFRYRTAEMSSKLFLLLLFAVHALSSNFTEENSTLDQGAQDDESKVYYFKKMSGVTCAYTASWLAHVNLFRRVTWYAHIVRYCIISCGLYFEFNCLIANFFFTLQKGT